MILFLLRSIRANISLKLLNRRHTEKYIYVLELIARAMKSDRENSDKRDFLDNFVK